MIIYNAPVRDIYEGKLEEEFIGTLYIPVFHVHLPELIGARYGGPFAQTVNLLMIYQQVIVLSETDCKLLMSISYGKPSPQTSSQSHSLICSSGTFSPSQEKLYPGIGLPLWTDLATGPWIFRFD